ncbi:MAG: hypothetical protein JWL81_894 [Verrucomicrobiales bacterium]|nr:hypothetical protein [Verrucomicrobiales bacterium]
MSISGKRCLGRQFPRPGVLAALSFIGALFHPIHAGAASIARDWDEEILAAIRLDFPNPPVHARNLHHLSTAMWDAWAAYDANATGYLHHEKAFSSDPAAARREAISYASYRILRARFAQSANVLHIYSSMDQRMAALGFDINNTGTVGPSPSALGNRIAAHLLSFSLDDGSDEPASYLDTTYQSLNTPLKAWLPGVEMVDPNRWQPLQFQNAATQNGLPASPVQRFVGSQWNGVRAFGLFRDHPDDVCFDPGAPPQLGGAGGAYFKECIVELIRASSRMDPADPATVNLSPGSTGNNSLGQNDGAGHAVNPVTGLPYPANVVPRADYQRVLAEFWADGPKSETPPGHWNVIANKVTDALTEYRPGGSGPAIDALEWDVKLYFTLNAAVHNAAVSVWGCKRKYDFVRPISAIRYMGQRGQCTDPLLPSYDPMGLPLVPGLIELITDESSAPGARHADLFGFVGKVAILAWPGAPATPETSFSGARWILPEAWVPYQKTTFVTPAFAGYVSGHSGFSRAAAEVLAQWTGSPFFPGGLATHTVAPGGLEFEAGPQSSVTLQWATYYDAADQAGQSRIFGGIHFACDDLPGRVMGSKCATAALTQSAKYFDGSILSETFSVALHESAPGEWELKWPSTPGLYYKVQTSETLAGWEDLTQFGQAARTETIYKAPSSPATARHFRVVRRP